MKETFFCRRDPVPLGVVLSFLLLANAPFKLLVPVLLLLIIPAGVQAQFNFTTNNGAITITKYTGTNAVVLIPSTTNGFLVTVIEGDKGAFSHSGVTDVTIPDSVTNIGAFTFSFCTNLTSIIIPDSVVFVGDQAFAFCSSLTNAALGTNVASVGYALFRACNKLTTVTVSALNTNYISVAGVLFNKSQTILVAYPPGKSGSYSITNTVTSIGSSAFETCAGLTGVTVPNSVTNIGMNAFYSCTSLAHIAVPDSVTSIGQEAFYSCNSLTAITVPNSVTYLGNSMFLSCLNLTNVIIENGVFSIPEYTFNNCTRLTTVTIGISVTNIGYDAFSYCGNLASVYFKGDAPGLALQVFYADNKLTVYYLPATTGWDKWVSPPEAVLWNPEIQTTDGNFGVRSNHFGFNITGTANIPIVVAACTNPATPTWFPLQTCTITNGSIYFSDPDWTNYPARLYRIRSP
jgi:hypothetical protein